MNTHRELCEIGAKWLKRPASQNGHGCHLAIVEAACYGENPDVIGFRHGCHEAGSIVLEIKTSCSDFLRDAQKPHRAENKGMGKWRYYVCPVDLIKPDELPEKWGLIYVAESGRVKVVAGACAGNNKHMGKRRDHFAAWEFSCRDADNEQSLLIMMLNRIGNPEEVNQRARDYTRLKTQHFELQQKFNDLSRKLYQYQAACQ